MRNLLISLTLLTFFSLSYHVQADDTFEDEGGLTWVIVETFTKEVLPTGHENRLYSISVKDTSQSCLTAIVLVKNPAGEISIRFVPPIGKLSPLEELFTKDEFKKFKVTWALSMISSSFEKGNAEALIKLMYEHEVISETLKKHLLKVIFKEDLIGR